MYAKDLRIGGTFKDRRIINLAELCPTLRLPHVHVTTSAGATCLRFDDRVSDQ